MPSAHEMLTAALAHHQAGRLPEAEAAYREILAVEPSSVDAWHLLGILSQQTGQRQQAEECLRRALSLNPDSAEARYNLGLVLLSEHKPDEAVDCFDRAVALRPDFADAKNNLALALNDRAIACRQRGEFQREIANYRRAIELNPNYAGIHVNLGIACKSLGQVDEAIACFRRALELDPNLALASASLGLALYERGDVEAAIRLYRKALTLDATDAGTHNNLGLALRLQGKIAEAAAGFRKALELGLDQAEVHSNLGLALHDLGELDEAVTWYERALVRNPDFIDAQVGLSTLLLLKGDFASGWTKYELRWKKKDQFSVRALPQPQWNGESLAGKAILLYAEQGLGDTIQFVRYAAVLKEQGAQVVFECQKPLMKLLASYRHIDQLVAEGSELPAFDFHLPLLSVPRVQKTSLATIPGEVPYLFADAGLVDEWSEKLQEIRGRKSEVGRQSATFLIGINWHGRAGHVQAERRDIPLRHFAALAAMPGVCLISLQKDGGKELAAPAAKAIVDLGGQLDREHGPFMDTAAIMMNLDLVITSDTSIAHLAGALGVAVWVPLPLVPDWRWLTDRTDSPWYPTMRLFRQRQAGDWERVFEEIRAALLEKMQNAERRIQK
jgi:tetratricopeptide (TPR) repeat protein